MSLRFVLVALILIAGNSSCDKKESKNAVPNAANGGPQPEVQVSDATPSQPAKVDKATFDQLTAGMSEADVEQLLGRTGRSEPRPGGLTRKTWTVEPAEMPGKQIEVRLDFQNGRVKRKAAREPTAAPAVAAPPYSSPQAAFEAFDAALSVRAWEKALVCLTPEFQDIAVSQLVTQVVLARAWSQARKRPPALTEVPDILRAHGLDETTLGAQELYHGGKKAGAARAAIPAAVISQAKDKPGLFTELMDLVETEEKTKPDAAITLEDVSVTGDSAIGQVSLPTRKKKLPMGFRKTSSVDGWRLDADSRLDFVGLLSVRLGFQLVTMEWLAK